MFQISKDILIIAAQVILCVLAFITGDHDGRTHFANVKMTKKQSNAWHRVGAAIYILACVAYVGLFGWMFIAYSFLAWVGIHSVGYNKYIGKGWGYMGDGVELTERILKFLFKNGLRQMECCIAAMVIINVLLFAKHFPYHSIFTIKQ